MDLIFNNYIIIARMILKLTNRFSNLNAQFLLNKSRNAVRFESQNLLWDYQQSNYQTQAFAKGLASLNFKKNDNILLRLAAGQQSEAYVAKLGCAWLGANLIVSHAKNQDQLDSQIKSNSVKAIIFEPTLALGEDLSIDVLNRLIPELAHTKNGQRLRSSKYASLSALVQTNFYSYPGVYKFRSLLNYAEDRYFKVAGEDSFSPAALPASENSLFITQPASELGFRAGVLNSNINGRYLVVVQPKDVSRIAEAHGNKVDLVASEDIPNLHAAVNVFVAKGSNVCTGHANRVEI